MNLSALLARKHIFLRAVCFIGWIVPVACQSASIPTTHPSAPTSTAVEASAAGQWTTYRNDRFSYRVDVAPQWSIDDSSKDEVIIFVGRPDGLAGLHILTLGWSGTAGEFAEETVKFHRRRAMETFEIVSRSQIVMDSGWVAERIEMLVQNEGRFCVEHLVDLVMVVESRAFALQGSICETVADLYLEDMQVMQHSFKVEAPQARNASPRQ